MTSKQKKIAKPVMDRLARARARKITNAANVKAARIVDAAEQRAERIRLDAWRQRDELTQGILNQAKANAADIIMDARRGAANLFRESMMKEIPEAARVLCELGKAIEAHRVVLVSPDLDGTVETWSKTNGSSH